MSINAWGSDDPAEVAKGGTGNATLTDHGILLGSGTAAVTPTAAPTNGQLLIGNTGSDPSLAVPTGDTNEIAIGTGAGSLSIGIADDCVLPGNAAFTWVDGTTAQEPAGSNGQARYDTTTNKFRGYENGAWTDFITTGSGGTGAWVFLDQSTATSAASFAWDNTIITSTYDHYAILHTAVKSAAGTQAHWQVSPDNGSTYRTSGYSGSYLELTTARAVSAGLMVGYFVSSTSVLGVCGITFLHRPTSSVRTSMSGSVQAPSSLYSTTTGVVASYYGTAESNDNIRFIFSSGNIASGTFAIYGLKTS